MHTIRNARIQRRFGAIKSLITRNPPSRHEPPRETLGVTNRSCQNRRGSRSMAQKKQRLEETPLAADSTPVLVERAGAVSTAIIGLMTSPSG